MFLEPDYLRRYLRFIIIHIFENWLNKILKVNIWLTFKHLNSGTNHHINLSCFFPFVLLFFSLLIVILPFPESFLFAHLAIHDWCPSGVCLLDQINVSAA